jgi:UDP-glucose 4-epimerase
MRVLVTGGAGYVGTELVGALARRQDVEEVVVYDNLSRRNHNLFLLGGSFGRSRSAEGASLSGRRSGKETPAGPVRFVSGELLDTRKLEASLDGIDTVYHLAAKVSTPFANEDFHGFDQINHWGTAELSYILERRPVTRLVYSSSTSVYGTPAGEATEATPPDPKTTYGLSKHRGEQMLARLADRLQLHIFRCANVYGYSPSMRFDAVINRYMFEAHFNGRITVHGSGHQHRAFVHIANVARTLANAPERLPSGTYNLVEQNLSILEITSHIQELYPDLEMLFIQQDVELRDLRVRPDPRLDALGLFDGRSFDDQLKEFQQHFSFG